MNHLWECKFHQAVGYQARWGNPAGLHADMRRVITKSKRRARVKLGEIHIIIVADLGREREILPLDRLEVKFFSAESKNALLG